MKQVICIKWGTVYGPEFVNVLYGMVSRNVTGEFQLICFTDDATGIRPEVKCLPLPQLGCEIPPEVPGKWPKIALWNKNLFGLTGNALFIDLDSVIVSNIDAYFTHGDPDKVYTARNWVRHFGKFAQTSVFRFPIGKNGYMLENLQANSAEISRKYRFEQNYVTENVRGGVNFWPEGWTRHFGLHCAGIWPLRWLRPAKLPPDAKIITFPGPPKPPDAILGQFTSQTPHISRRAYFKWVMEQRRTDRRWRRLLHRFLFPTDWIAEHWRE